MKVDGIEYRLINFKKYTDCYDCPNFEKEKCKVHYEYGCDGHNIPFPIKVERQNLDSAFDEIEEDPLSIQVGGDHYKGWGIQPVEFTETNNLTFSEGNIVKYITRHKSKNGVQDVEKVVHYVDFVKKYRNSSTQRTLSISAIDFIASNSLGFLEGRAIEALCNYVESGETSHLDTVKAMAEKIIETYD